MNDQLPQGWNELQLRDVCEVLMGQAPKGSECNTEGRGTVFVKAGEFTRDFPVIREWTVRPLKTAKKGDVLICVVGATCGKLNLGIDCAIGRSVAALRPSKVLLTDVLYRQLQPMVTRLRLASTGSAQGVIAKHDLEEILLKLPPLGEQQRIVAKLEKLLDQVDACQKRLARIPALLKRFRQAVLAAACSGRLTADWREENSSPTPAVELLAKIEEERKRAAGKLGSKRRNEPVQIDVSDLPVLPEHWLWATLDQIVQEGRPIIYGIIKPGPHDPRGVPYVRVFEMKGEMIAPLSELKRASLERASKFTRATLKAGDVLISKDGTIGRVAIVPPELEGGNITQHLVRASVHPLLSRDFIACAIRSQHAQNWLIGEKKGVALQGVNVEDFRRLPLPIPPLPEQQEIVRRVEEFFALADRIEIRFALGRKRVDSITQAILAKAFRGELVPTEFELAKAEGRSFESAEELLKRIGHNGDSQKMKQKPERKLHRT